MKKKAFNKRKTVFRTIEAFAIHGHLGSGDRFNYGEIFGFVAGIEPRRRSVQVEGRVFVLSTFEIAAGRVSIIAHEGDADVSPLYYDLDTNTERIGRKGQSEILSTRTHALIDIEKRIVVVEYNQRGAKASHIVRIISRLAQEVTGDSAIEMDFSPFASQSFNEEMDTIDRIRRAEVQVFEPNLNWNEENVKLVQVSNARSYSLGLNAKRNKGLSLSRGIIPAIRDLIRKPLPNLKDAAVEGVTREGRSKTVRLKSHVTKEKFELTVGEKDGYPKTASAMDALSRFLGHAIKESDHRRAAEDDSEE